MEGNEIIQALSLLKTRPIRMQLRRGVNRSRERCELINIATSENIVAEIVLKIFLNGTGENEIIGQFVSISFSIQVRREEHEKENGQNILEEHSFVITIFLRNPNDEANPYKTECRMIMCTESRENEKVIHKFISKRRLEDYTSKSENSLLIGVSIFCEY